MKILPSPMRSVLAACWIASTARSTRLSSSDHLDFDLGQEVDHVLGASVQLGVPLLTAEALDLGHGHALQADLLQRLLDLVELERLDDRLDLLHRIPTFPKD